MHEGGVARYIATARELAARESRAPAPVLLRMLAAKALFGLSPKEYGLFRLESRPLLSLRHYRTKKQTSAMFARINDPAAIEQVDDKLAFHERCNAGSVPVPTLHALIVARPPVDPVSVPVLDGFPALLRQFGDTDETRLILKPRSDALGTGVRFVAIRRGEPFDIDGRPIDVGSFAADLAADMARDDYLVQSFVEPDPDVAALGSGRALGTCRIATCPRGDEVTILYALLRIPAAGNVHDNFASAASTNLIAQVDIGTGELGPAYGRRSSGIRYSIESFDANPDTGRPIRGTSLPRWREVCELVDRAARLFPKLPFLGFDVAIAKQGLVVIEANGNPDIIGVQVSSGRGAAEILRPLFE